MMMRSLMLLLILFTAVRAQKAIVCPETCKSCSAGTNFCNACKDGYQPTHVGQCLSTYTVENCQLYGLRDACLLCKPTYRLLTNNTCSKMSDGCLIAGPTGSCTKCMDGAVRNKLNQCSTRLLNCRRTNQNMECILCQPGYKFQNSKCISNDTNCQFVQPINGLCMLCKQGYKLVEYRCVKLDELQNCYLASSDFQTCYYCKMGYEAYFGRCLIQQDIDYLDMKTDKKKCPPNSYYDPKDGKCNSLPPLCEKFDYGFLRCVSCSGNNVMLSGLCRDPALASCLTFNPTNPYTCLTCQPKYFLTNNRQCQEFPPFCEQVSNQRCVKCINLFLLNAKGQCEDPNCQMLDSMTSACIRCKASFVKNGSTGICTFQDVNCAEKGANSTCARCKDQYQYNEKTKICKFVDPQCKMPSETKVCEECNSNYYLNSKTKVCMMLPPKCLSADSEGNCQYCSEGYALMTSYECALIVNISNCEKSLASNPMVCQKCKEGFYKDEKDLCLEMPIYCEVFDPAKRVCTKCHRNSTLKNGICYDNFCQYFADDGECLGCKTGYQYGSRGECVPQKNDPNCKQFLNNQCKQCSDRYYFNSAWKCTNVSNLCRNYNPNNGDCTSCYPGYALEDGACIRESERVICVAFVDGSKDICAKCNLGYTLNEKDGKCNYNESGCIQKNITTGACLLCLDNYLLDEGIGYCLKVANASQYQNRSVDESTLVPTYSDQNCVKLNDNKTACETCVSRMFYSANQSKCIAVDANCRNYIPASGQCRQCYSGFSVASDKLRCENATLVDQNCKTINANQSDECIECYNGFYYERSKKKCVAVDALCKEVNLTNGFCLSCWEGYTLSNNRCVLANTDNVQVINPTPTTDTPNTAAPEPSSTTSKTKKQINCLEYSQSSKKCTKCIKGTAMDLQTHSCQRPLLGYDENCTEYRRKICSKCKENFYLKSKYCVSIKS